MTHYSKITRTELVLIDPDPDVDAVLMRVLTRTVGPDKFDEHSIAGNVNRWPELRAALAFLGPRYDRAGYLASQSTRRVRRWLDEVEGREIVGLMLVRDRQGWRDIVPAEARPLDGTASDRLRNLLIALRDEFGRECFDGSRISARVADNPALLAALAAVLGKMKTRRSAFGALLNGGSLARVQRWLSGGVETEAGGLWIVSDRFGWRYVRPVGEEGEP